MLKTERLVVGPLETNCYLIYDQRSKKCIIVDPGDESEYISSKIEELDLDPVSIIVTHGHFDHILGVSDLKLIYKIPFFCHKNDLFLVDSMNKRAKRWLKRKITEQDPKVDYIFEDYIKIPDFNIKVLETPGHTPGSVSFYLKEEKILFTGDTIFANGIIGRYDLSYSHKEELDKSLNKILKFPGETKIFPGHNELTNVKEEKKYYK